MLDTDTKRRIDTARDILVGKVPDPKSQVEQITIALIYKFMDDMDAESEELGGKRKFFTKEFSRYGWAQIMRAGLGGHEMLGLYAEGITKMPENPGIPLHRIAFQPGDEKQLSEVMASYTYFEDNDVLLAKVTPCFENGKAGIARNLLNGVGFGSSEFYVLRCRGQVI